MRSAAPTVLAQELPLPLLLPLPLPVLPFPAWDSHASDKFFQSVRTPFIDQADSTTHAADLSENIS